MDNRQLLLTMLHSQQIYVADNIEKPKNKTVYLQTVVKFLDLFSSVQTFEQAKSEATKLIIELKKHPIKWDFIGNKLKYTNLAIDHIKDIIHSIDTRFVKGGSKAYDIW